jgi:hypothetical protein
VIQRKPLQIRTYPAHMPDVPMVTPDEIKQGSIRYVTPLPELTEDTVGLRTPATKFAEAFMGVGKRAFTLYQLMPRYADMTQAQGDRITDTAISIMRFNLISYARKAATIGWLYDTFFVITRLEPAPKTTDRKLN